MVWVCCNWIVEIGRMDIFMRTACKNTATPRWRSGYRPDNREEKERKKKSTSTRKRKRGAGGVCVCGAGGSRGE